jgi:cytochrome c oxidase cbb3-type subunit 3
MKPHRAFVLLLAPLLLAACEREMRRFEPPGSNETPTASAQRLSPNQPALALGGGVKTAARDYSMYQGNAYAVAQGKTLFTWYNCASCHGNGGGGMGPALMDTEWRYGSDPASIFASIEQGRPNGMPSFGGHIPEDQIWMLVAYVQSMSGGVRKDVAPSRGDSMYPGNPENARPSQPARPEGRMQ